MCRSASPRGRRATVRILALLALLLLTLFFGIIAAEALGIVQTAPQPSPRTHSVRSGSVRGIPSW